MVKPLTPPPIHKTHDPIHNTHHGYKEAKETCGRNKYEFDDGHYIYAPHIFHVDINACQVLAVSVAKI